MTRKGSKTSIFNTLNSEAISIIHKLCWPHQQRYFHHTSQWLRYLLKFHSQFRFYRSLSHCIKNSLILLLSGISLWIALDIDLRMIMRPIWLAYVHFLYFPTTALGLLIFICGGASSLNAMLRSMMPKTSLYFVQFFIVKIVRGTIDNN